MQEEPNEKVTYMTSLQKLLNKLDLEGYTEQYKVENGLLHALSSNRTYGPEHVKAVNFYRFEGPSNPDDMSICYVIETDDGLKGTIIDAYGVYAEEGIGEFMQSVEIFKKTLRTGEHNQDIHNPQETDRPLPEEVLNKAQEPDSIPDPLAQQNAKSA
jgi:hypothetical protein